MYDNITSKIETITRYTWFWNPKRNKKGMKSIVWLHVATTDIWNRYHETHMTGNFAVKLAGKC